MNAIAQALDKVLNTVADRVANPARVSDPDRLRAAVGGRTVLVTGASYGIGEATARRLAAAGATVLVVARSEERLGELTAAINAGGGRAVAYPTDLTDESAVSALTKQITEEHGPLDVVVSNAGKSLRRSLHHQYDRPHDFQRTIDVNYLGPVRLLLGLLPAMRDNGRGHVVNVSSVGVRVVPGPQWGAYQASKGAFDRWLRSVAPIARRRRARQHGLLRVGPDPDDRAHTGFGPAARPVAGPGGRRHRQGRHRAAAHPRAALGAAGRAGLGAAGRPGRPRRTAVASPVLHRRRGGRP